MKRIITASAVISVLLIAAISMAQSPSFNFEITKSTIDNGGGMSTGGDFSLLGTIGQPDANAQISHGAGFLLAGGFWAKTHDVIFRNGFENN